MKKLLSLVFLGTLTINMPMMSISPEATLALTAIGSLAGLSVTGDIPFRLKDDSTIKEKSPLPTKADRAFVGSVLGGAATCVCIAATKQAYRLYMLPPGVVHISSILEHCRRAALGGSGIGSIVGAIAVGVFTTNAYLQQRKEMKEITA